MCGGRGGIALRIRTGFSGVPRVVLAQRLQELQRAYEQSYHSAGDMEQEPSAHEPVVGGTELWVGERNLVVVEVIAEDGLEHEGCGDTPR